jgi:uncharacterized protein Yka (UPF0111/DUF47 family)
MSKIDPNEERELAGLYREIENKKYKLECNSGNVRRNIENIKRLEEDSDIVKSQLETKLKLLKILEKETGIDAKKAYDDTQHGNGTPSPITWDTGTK